MTTWQNWKKKFKFQIWKKNCFPGLSPKPVARVNPKSRRVSNIISNFITVILKLLKNQITTSTSMVPLPVLSWKLLVFWGLWNGGNWKKGGFFFSGFFKEPKNGSSLIIWYWYKYNQWFFFWWNFAKLWNSTAVSELHKGEKLVFLIYVVGQGLVTKSRFETLQKFKKPYGHEHEPCSGFCYQGTYIEVHHPFN